MNIALDNTTVPIREHFGDQRHWWTNSLYEQQRSPFDEGYDLSRLLPVVYHGYAGVPKSIVITEDDYKDSSLPEVVSLREPVIAAPRSKPSTDAVANRKAVERVKVAVTESELVRFEERQSLSMTSRFFVN